MPDDELTDVLDKTLVDNSATDADDKTAETSEQTIARLEKENKDIKDGNSRLGREFKNYKEDNDDKYGALLDKITDMTGSQVPASNQVLSDSYEDEEDRRLATIADQRLDAREKRNEASRSKYIDDYAKAVNVLGRDEDAAVYEAIVREMEGMTGFSNNGSEDALRHYQKAEAVYYKGQYKQVSGGAGNPAFRSQAPTGGVGGSSTITHKESVDTEVTAAEQDAHVQGYMAWRNRRKGNDPEFLKRALAAESKLQGKVRV